MLITCSKLNSHRSQQWSQQSITLVTRRPSIGYKKPLPPRFLSFFFFSLATHLAIFYLTSLTSFSMSLSPSKAILARCAARTAARQSSAMPSGTESVLARCAARKAASQPQPRPEVMSHPVKSATSRYDEAMERIAASCAARRSAREARQQGKPYPFTSLSLPHYLYLTIFTSLSPPRFHQSPFVYFFCLLFYHSTDSESELGNPPVRTMLRKSNLPSVTKSSSVKTSIADRPSARASTLPAAAAVLPRQQGRWSYTWYTLVIY